MDLKKVVEHVCDTAGHLLKPRVSLEKMVDQTTPLIAGDGSRIVQVCLLLPLPPSPACLICLLHLPTSFTCLPASLVCLTCLLSLPAFICLPSLACFACLLCLPASLACFLCQPSLAFLPCLLCLPTFLLFPCPFPCLFPCLLHLPASPVTVERSALPAASLPCWLLCFMPPSHVLSSSAGHYGECW